MPSIPSTLLCLLGVILAAVSSSAAPTTKLPLPNIVLVTADDLGMHLSNYGDPYARTPEFEKLGREAVQFNHAYVTQASCSPSRSTIFTGLYPHQNGQYGLGSMENRKYGYEMHAQIKTLPMYLKERNYRTAVIGKIHVASGNPDAFPFDYANTATTRTLDVATIAKEAGSFLSKQDGEPSFLMVNYFDPHRHTSVKGNGFIDVYEDLPKDPLQADEITTFPFMGFDPEELHQQIAGYYNSVARLDAGIGLLINELKSLGLWENTLFIFMSDHGAPFTFAKTGCYEASLHVPMFISWPAQNIKKDTTSQSMISSIDLVPTILAAAGIKIPSELAGFDLLPLLKGDIEVMPRDYIFGEYNSHTNQHYYPRRSVRGERFKLIRNLQTWRPNPLKQLADRAYSLSRSSDTTQWVKELYDKWVQPPEFELYDLANDPNEFTNLASNPEYAEQLKELKSALAAWRTRSGDMFDSQTQNPSTTIQ
ncbi:sulfatase family protein [Coraliomargarita sp. W4R72]